MSGQDGSGTRRTGRTRTFMHGGPPDWALELVPVPITAQNKAKLTVIVILLA